MDDRAGEQASIDPPRQRSKGRGRIDPALLERVNALCHRVVDVADAIAEQGRNRRVVDQLYGCGTSVGANCFEADEAHSRKDFCRCLVIAIKELAEVRFWLRFVATRGWFATATLSPLLDEAEQVKRILGAIVYRTRRNDAAA